MKMTSIVFLCRNLMNGQEGLWNNTFFKEEKREEEELVIDYTLFVIQLQLFLLRLLVD